MTKYAQEIVFNGSVGVSNVYSANSITITGNSVRLYNLGSNPEDKFLGPAINKVIRVQDTFGVAAGAIHLLDYYGKTLIFVGTGATAAATRTVMMYTYDPVTQDVTTGTLVTMTYPTATAHTLKALRAIIRPYSTGTVSVSGTAVTGSGTSWRTTLGACVGSRIGFGSTDPSQISTWYEISAIGSDTGITLTGSAGTIAGGTDYVIEDFRMVMITTNATTTNGGLFVATGLRLENFQSGATIPAATTVDNIRAVYWLKDRAVVTQLTGAGVVTGEFTDFQNEFIYSIDGAATTNLKLYKYNIRANLTASGGISSGAVTLVGANTVNTGTVVVTGAISSFNNGRSANTMHGPGANVDCIYLSTASRIIRVPKSGVTGGSTGFVADTMNENPQGGTSSVTTVGFLSFDYADSIDKFIIGGYAAPTGRIYVTDYKSDGGQFDSHMGITSTLVDSGIGNNPLFPKISSTAYYVWAEAGNLYIINSGATAIAGIIHIYPAFNAHWSVAAETGNRAILPKITFASTPSRFTRVYTNEIEWIETLTELAKTTDPYRLKYRTSGIDDNSGTWYDVPQSGDLTGIAPTAEIQFCIEFRTWTEMMVPSRVTSLSLVYEADDALPDEYQWNLGDSNTVDGTFGFTQKQLFTAWPLLHTINIYRADNDTIALTQNNTVTTYGEFEFWNGSAWAANTANNTIGTRRRFRPTGSLPGGVDLYATITVEE